MNSIAIACGVSLATAYMLTVSYHSYYLYESVLLLEKQKRSFYQTQQLLAYGFAYYKKYEKKLTLPFMLNYQVGTPQSPVYGSIRFNQKNNHIEMQVSLHNGRDHQVLKVSLPK